MQTGEGNSFVSPWKTRLKAEPDLTLFRSEKLIVS